MIVSIHQPNFLPWLGYFNKIRRSDYFVFYDWAQYTTNNYINRCQIKTPQGVQWLTVPVTYHQGELIRDIKICNPGRAIPKLLKTIEANYRRARWYDTYCDDLEYIFQESGGYLARLNIDLITAITEDWMLLYDTKFIYSMNIVHDDSDDATDKLIKICQALDADTYLSGQGGMGYQNEGKFQTAGIEVIYNEFQHPKYEQRWEDLGFMQGLSVLDLVLNNGKESPQILDTMGER